MRPSFSKDSREGLFWKLFICTDQAHRYRLGYRGAELVANEGSGVQEDSGVRRQSEYQNTGDLGRAEEGIGGPGVKRKGPGLQRYWPPPPQPLLTTVWLGGRGGGHDSIVVPESARAHCRQGTRLREMLIIC